MHRLPIIIIRPQPGNDATAAKLIAAGVAQSELIQMPLFEVRPLEWSLPRDFAAYDGVIISSANSIRMGGVQLAALTGLPCFAVGSATANAAKLAGFQQVTAGAGGIEELIPLLQGKGHRHVLRLAGKDHIALKNMPLKLSIDTAVLYESAAIWPSTHEISALSAGGFLLIHSPRAARHWRDVTQKFALNPSNYDVLALSPAIEKAAGDGWRSVASTVTPDEADMLTHIIARNMR